MRLPVMLFVVSLLALSACQDGASRARADKGDGTVRIAPTDASGGIRLAPQTIVKTVDVVGSDKDRAAGSGYVHIGFTSPYRPSRLLGYYRVTAAHAGYAVTLDGKAGLSAMKAKTRFALSVAPLGDGSRGAITIRGD